MCAVPSVAVFSSYLILCSLGMLLRYFLNDFELVPLASVLTVITFVCTLQMRCVSVVRSVYFRIFLASFLSPEMSSSSLYAGYLHLYM